MQEELEKILDGEPTIVYLVVDNQYEGFAQIDEFVYLNEGTAQRRAKYLNDRGFQTLYDVEERELF